MPAAVRVQLGAALGQRAAVGSAAARPHERVPDAAARRLMARAARATLRRAGIRSAQLSITLFSDPEITDMNREFLSHEGATDVISFALYDEGEDPVGDIYIGFDQAVRQAVANGIHPAEELARLAVHGTLHVLGHDHPEDTAARLRSQMWRLQESIVAQVIAS